MKLQFLLCFVAIVSADNVSPNKLLFDLTNFVDHFSLNTAYVPCTDKSYQYCQYQFNQYLGFNRTWLNVDLFSQVIDSYYKQDVRGLIKLCHSRSLLKHCFGTQYASCTSRNQFVRKGANIFNAYQISGLFNSLDFQCTGAIIQAIENWPCIYDTWSSAKYQSARNTCLADFSSKPLNNQNAVCTAGETLATCLASQFSTNQHQCNNKELIWFECERTINYFRFDGNCPDIRCQLPKLSSVYQTVKAKTYATGRATIHSKRSHRAET